jgi:hypothetical protein
MTSLMFRLVSMSCHFETCPYPGPHSTLRSAQVHLQSSPVQSSPAQPNTLLLLREAVHVVLLCPGLSVGPFSVCLVDRLPLSYRVQGPALPAFLPRRPRDQPTTLGSAGSFCCPICSLIKFILSPLPFPLVYYLCTVR